MKQNKLVIVVLVVIAVLFVLGLSSGLFRDKEDNDDKISMSKVEKLKGRWVASLKGFMSPFRNSLDRRRLKEPSDDRQPPKEPPDCPLDDRTQTYKLDNSGICVIEIAAYADAEKVENAILSVEDNDAILKVAYPTLNACAKPRGMRVSLKKMKTPKMATGIGKLKQPKVQKDSSPPQLELIVVYLPKERGGVNEDYCKVVKEVSLSVLKKGGTIQMQCSECDSQQKRTVGVKLK